MDRSNVTRRAGNSKSIDGAEAAAALYGGQPIRPIRRDRYGEVVEPTIYPAAPPAITAEMHAARYYRARARAERIVMRLTAAELAAVEDALSAERSRRRR